MAVSLEDHTVLITGAASGLGRALASQLAPLGCRLLLVDHDDQRLTSVANALSGSTDVATFECDISELDQVGACFEAVAAATGGSLDVLVNNAGIWTDDEIERRDPDRRRTAFLVNALGPIQVTQAALPLLRASTRAAQILNVISTSAASDTDANDNRRWSTYGATKAALAGYTTTLTSQLASDGIKVSGIFPGGFESDMYESAGSSDEQHDAFWMMRTEDVAEALVFALTRPPDVQVERMVLTKRAPELARP